MPLHDQFQQVVNSVIITYDYIMVKLYQTGSVKISESAGLWEYLKRSILWKHSKENGERRFSFFPQDNLKKAFFKTGTVA